MSKSVRRILPIVAAVAIPFAAPAIAAKVAASGALGGAITSALGTKAGFAAGSALTGAALGAGSAALTGQRIGRGALMGGIGGGIGGFIQGPAQVAGLTPPGAPPVGTESLAGLGGPAAPSGFVEGGLEGLITRGAGQPQQAFSMPGSLSPAQIANVRSQPQTFAQALRQVPGAIAERFRDPRALADFTLRAGGMIAGSVIAGSGLSPEERRLLAAQEQELRWLQQNNQAEFQRRLAEAQQLLGEARYFDPEYFGLQAARRQQMIGAVAQRDQLRGLSPQQREEAQRRMQLDTARNVGTAYDVGYGQAVQSRIQTQEAGLRLLPQPSAFATGGFAGLAEAYGGAQTRGRQQASDIGSFFEQLSPMMTEEERRRLAEERRRREQGGP